MCIVAGGLRAGNLYSIVVHDNLKGLANDKGQILIPAEYEDLGWSAGPALVLGDVIGYSRGGRWGLLNLQNQRLSEPVYTHLEPYGGQLVLAARFLPNNLDVRYGLITTRGKVHLEFNYARLEPQGDRLIATILERSGMRSGLIDRQARVLISIDHTALHPVGSRHYAAADRQGRFALYDAEGRQLTAYRLDSVTRLDDRYSFLHEEGRLGLLDHGSSRTLLPAWKTLRLDADGSLHGESFTDWSVFDETFQLSGHLYFDDVEPMDIRLLRVHAGKARAIIDSSGTVISPFTRYDIQPLTPEFFLLSHDRRSGVVNRQGNPILNTEYGQIRWQNSRFLVYQVLDGRRGWCLHDETGSRCGNTVYDDMHWLGGRYFAVKRDKYWGVIDMMGRDVLYCKYDSILAQNNGYFKVNFLGEDGILNERESWEVVPQKKEIELIGPGRYLVRSPYGSYVAWYPNQIEFRAEYYLYPFGEYYLERTDAGKLGLVNAAGARILPPLYDRIWELQEDSLFYARSGEGFTFVTRNGRRLNQGDTRIQDIRPMSEGYIGVRIDGRWGFLDPNGLLRIANRYEDIGPFSEGLAAVRILGRWGFIDKHEAIRVQPHYSAVGAFRDGVCRVEINGRHGLIDAGGHLLLDPEYDELRPLEGGGYIAVRDGQMGLVSARGRLLILPRFERMTDLGNGALIVERGDKAGVMTYDGLSPIPMIYDRVRFDPYRKRYLAALSGEWQALSF
jgi:hypothetical protein